MGVIPVSMRNQLGQLASRMDTMRGRVPRAAPLLLTACTPLAAAVQGRVAAVSCQRVAGSPMSNHRAGVSPTSFPAAASMLTLRGIAITGDRAPVGPAQR